MARTGLMGSALSAAFIASIGLATPAQALDPKQCLPMVEMNAALKAEGQKVMIIGDRMAINDSPEKKSGVAVTRYVNTVTQNADGSLGYQLEGDLPRAQPSTSVCVRAKLTNVRMFDARTGAIPDAVYLGGQFDAVVKENAAKGTRPMVLADTVHTGADGKNYVGLPMVMFGNVASKSASIATKLPDGKPQFLVLLGDTEYAPAGLSRLNQQLAMRTP